MSTTTQNLQVALAQHHARRYAPVMRLVRTPVRPDILGESWSEWAWNKTPWGESTPPPAPPAAAPAQPGQPGPVAQEGWLEWARRQWGDTNAGLHRIIYQGAWRGLTGLNIPAEAGSPTAAREYMANTMRTMAGIYGWPSADVESRVRAILSTPNGSGVVSTLERIAVYGPPATWTMAQGWYDLLGDVAQSAGMVSAGEAAGVVQQAGERTLTATVARIDRTLDVADKAAGGAGFGIGVGVVALAATAAAVVFWPEIATMTAINNRRGR